MHDAPLKRLNLKKKTYRPADSCDGIINIFYGHVNTLAAAGKVV